MLPAALVNNEGIFLPVLPAAFSKVICDDYSVTRGPIELVQVCNDRSHCQLSIDHIGVTIERQVTEKSSKNRLWLKNGVTCRGGR